MRSGPRHLHPADEVREEREGRNPLCLGSESPHASIAAPAKPAAHILDLESNLLVYAVVDEGAHNDVLPGERLLLIQIHNVRELQADIQPLGARSGE